MRIKGDMKHIQGNTNLTVQSNTCMHHPHGCCVHSVDMRHQMASHHVANTIPQHGSSCDRTSFLMTRAVTPTLLKLP